MNNNIGKMKNIFEQIFNEQKERINKNISFVFNNKYSNFYKEKYSGLPEINSYTDFQKIPFLEKREMLSAGLKNFTFTSDGKIIRYMFSSGTTGKPLTTAHNAPSPKIPGRKEAFEKIKLSKALFLFPITTLHHQHKNLAYGDYILY